MALAPIPTQVKLEMSRKHKAENKKLIQPIKIAKSAEVVYRKELLTLVGRLRSDVSNQIIPLLRSLEPQYTSDGYAQTLAEAFAKLKSFYNGLDAIAQTVSTQFVSNTAQQNKKRFYASLENSIGVSLQSIIQNEDLTDILTATTTQNVGLITSIPAQYLKAIENIVYTGVTQKNSATSMTKQIMEQGGVSQNRAKLIARDQTSKLNSALTQQRAQNLGVEEYVWRTAEDDRVRPTHRTKNGKTFRYDDPPADTGNPGNDIQCRCIAQPIIKL